MLRSWCLLFLLMLIWAIESVSVNGQITNCTSRPGQSCSPMNWTIGECDVTTGLCSCNDSVVGNCFMLSDSTNYCLELRCYSYQEQDGTCRKGRQSRTVAVLLSVFLINFGAANFYIERYEFAIPQIILGLALCLFQFGSCAAAGTRDGDTSVPCIICCSINSVVSLLFLSWWIADLIIFATNKRLDGQSCPLY